MFMKGINYLTDINNNKLAVQIDLKLYGELWQDFYDRLLVEARKDEKSDSLESFVEKLEKDGLLDGEV